MDYLFCTVVVGAGATFFIDLWAIARMRLFGNPQPDYALVGRWLGHFAGGRFRHESIAASPPVHNERLIGWAAHYAVGVAFAAALILIEGARWLQHPTALPALTLGAATVALPFLVVQPGMGAGIAASRTRRPAAARLQSLTTHTFFGIGLYANGVAVSFLFPPGG